MHVYGQCKRIKSTIYMNLCGLNVYGDGTKKNNEHVTTSNKNCVRFVFLPSSFCLFHRVNFLELHLRAGERLIVVKT